ncbi:uroporphyrinogen decarboxylase family protein [Bacteroides sp. 224]|uniref:uroporphyrinogen decarboxylase family protein n=1 Tax=Bacteroides sp. 224 TaxID=2302936 RepID=UPI0013D8BF51|nr:uroporphyrinogen decarboxylase family protein [Bacteroides sp. 224]NDV64743.1 methylcobamide--CoM methyltransferase [Bacteroides sp. 224]
MKELINMRSFIAQTIADRKRIAIPIMTHPGIEMNGNTVYQAVTNGTIHAKAIETLDKRYPAAAATVIMDLTVEAEAFGAEIVFSDHEVPSVTGRLLNNEAAIEALQVPNLDKGRVGEYLKANQLAAEAITDKPVLAGCIGPYSLAGRLYDMSEIMMLIYIDPNAANLLLRKCTDFLLEYCKALKATGVNGVVIAEPAAGLLSNEDCQQYSSIYIKEIVEAVQDDYFAVILHNCGNTGHCTPAMVFAGAMGYHFGNKIDMTQAITNIPADAWGMGNLDPVGVFKQGTPESIKRDTLQLLKDMENYPNFVLSSGCDTPPHVSPENIDAFFQALKEYNDSSI